MWDGSFSKYTCLIGTPHYWASGDFQWRQHFVFLSKILMFFAGQYRIPDLLHT
jgi:hypothetical protein